MMHLGMILAVLGVAWYLRRKWLGPKGSWIERWQRSLLLFLFPPLLLIVTAASVACMGPVGQMVNGLTGWFSYLLSLCFLARAGVLCFKLARQGWKTLQKTRTYRLQKISGKSARILVLDTLFAAQIGFWQPELVVSSGLLQTFDIPHIEAVLAHEQAHYYYRDTFWFFWLGWVRQIAAWLPNTEALWQELLILRELRADAKAAQQVDPLILAESLLSVMSVVPILSENFCAAIGVFGSRNRLDERIEALLSAPGVPPSLNWESWSWLLLAFLPLLIVPFHR